VPSHRPLSIPVVLGPTRDPKVSVHAARFVYRQLRNREDVRTELIDADEPALSAERADAVVIVRDALDCSAAGGGEDSAHPATGVVAVAAGSFGNAPAVATSLALLGELGRMTMFWDVNLTRAGSVFEEQRAVLDAAVVRATDKFLGELIRLARLRRARPRVRLAGSPKWTQDTA